MSVTSNNKYKGFERAFCIRMKSTLTKRGCQFKQSTGYRVSTLSTTQNFRNQTTQPNQPTNQNVLNFLQDDPSSRQVKPTTNGHYSVRKLIQSAFKMCAFVLRHSQEAFLQGLTLTFLPTMVQLISYAKFIPQHALVASLTAH